MPESKYRKAFALFAIAGLVAALFFLLLKTWFYGSIYAGKIPPGIRESSWETFVWALPYTLRILQLVFSIFMLLVLASRISNIEQAKGIHSTGYLRNPLVLLFAGLTVLFGCGFLLA